MKTTTYIKKFSSESEARNWMVMKNTTSANDIFAMVPGPVQPFAVVDLITAIELGLGYEVSYSHLY